MILTPCLPNLQLVKVELNNYAKNAYISYYIKYFDTNK